MEDDSGGARRAVLSLSLSQSVCLSVSLSLSFCLSLAQSVCLCLSLPRVAPPPLTLSLLLSIYLDYRRANYRREGDAGAERRAPPPLSFSRTLTLSHTHTHKHTHTPPLCRVRTLWVIGVRATVCGYLGAKGT